MKVSVVIPAYNEEKWIGKTLEAVAKQDYPDFEIIVVDNASVDKTSEVVESYAKNDSRIKLVHQPKKGLLNAREAGRLAATGEIIAQLDADCLPKPNWITTAVGYFTPEIVVVTGPYHFYDAHGIVGFLINSGQSFLYEPAGYIAQKLNRGTLMVGGNSFIRASALEKIGGYDTSIDFYSEDTDTGSRLFKIGKVVFRNAIMVDSSARRFNAFGLHKLNNRYIKAFLTVIAGKKLKDNVETEHPR